jgi:predicted secreted Zn-dependent protease
VPHFGLVGDTYTVLLSGKDSDGRYCLIDMHVPPGGDRLPIATTSKKLSFFSMVKWRPRFKERNGLCELGKRCTFRQTLLINFITPHRSQRGCFASARRHPRGVLQKVGNTGCDAYHFASQSRCNAGSRVHQESN